MATWSVEPSQHDKRDASRPTKKVCSVCHRVGWHAPRDRKCKRIRVETRGMGVHTQKAHYYCTGLLTAVAAKPKAAAGLEVVAERKRRAAARQQARAEARAAALKTRIKRLQKALLKQTRKVSHYARLATRSDAEIAAQRDRIKVAQQVQVATRRLLKAAGVSEVIDAEREREKLARQGCSRIEPRLDA